MHQPEDRVTRALQLVKGLAPNSCVIVAGSVGTGEATTRDGAMLSDLEIAVVGGVRALLAARRTRRLDPSIESYFVSPWRMRYGLRRNLSVPRPNLPAYDLARHRRYGRLPRTAGEPRLWSADELSTREAVTLLSNRLAESLDARCPYSAIKVAVACGDAILMSRGQYAFGYRARESLFASDTESLTPSVCRVALNGYSAKLRGSPFLCDDEELRDAVREAFSIITGQNDFGNWVKTASCFSNAWTLDARLSEWRALHKVADALAVGVRASRRLGVARTLQFLRRVPYPAAAIYAAVVQAFLLPLPGSGPWPSVCDIPKSVANDTKELTRVWKAFGC
jgi:hypothetical protein